MRASEERGLHLIRYGVGADQRFLAGEFLGKYDIAAINGNMVAHTPAALARFLGERTASPQRATKPFIIDPLTHAFQHDPSKVMSRTPSPEDDEEESPRVKLSIRRMGDAFGEPVQSALGSRPILPSDFSQEAVRAGFCERVVRFQLDTIETAAQSSDSRKYLEYIGLGAIKPTLVVAPYFWMTAETIDDWLPRNLDFVKHSRAPANGTRLFAQVVITKDILTDEGKRSRIAVAYADADCDGVLLWIDEFSEHEATEDELVGLGELARSLSVRKPVYNLYGGYFSVLLCQLSDLKLLGGVCHGLEYGEDRSVVPVGGGIPMARFYLPRYHRRLRYPDAVRVARALGGFRSVQSYFDTICSCAECHAVISSEPARDFAVYGVSKRVRFQRKGHVVTLDYPTPETKEHCLRHYLHVKHSEFEDARGKNSAEVVKDLDALFAHAAQQSARDQPRHLRDWASAIRRLAQFLQ